MLPVAPVTFSTTSGCPSSACIASVTARTHKSDGPPTAVGTMIRTGFCGNDAAAAAPPTSATGIAAAMAILEIQRYIP